MSFRYPSKLRFVSLNKQRVGASIGKNRSRKTDKIYLKLKNRKKEKSRSKEAAALEAIRKFLLTIYDLTNRGLLCLFIPKIECIKINLYGQFKFDKKYQ